MCREYGIQRREQRTCAVEGPCEAFEDSLVAETTEPTYWADVEFDERCASRCAPLGERGQNPAQGKSGAGKEVPNLFLSFNTLLLQQYLRGHG